MIKKEYKTIKPLPDVPVGSVYQSSGKEGYYYTEAVNYEHKMRSMPFYIVELNKEWFQEIRK